MTLPKTYADRINVELARMLDLQIRKEMVIRTPEAKFAIPDSSLPLSFGDEPMEGAKVKAGELSNLNAQIEMCQRHITYRLEQLAQVRVSNHLAGKPLFLRHPTTREVATEQSWKARFAQWMDEMNPEDLERTYIAMVEVAKDENGNWVEV